MAGKEKKTGRGSGDAGEAPAVTDTSERPLVKAVTALLSTFDGAVHALMTRRRRDPGKGQWALPGGVVPPDKSLDAAALAVLQARGGISDVYLEQLYTFGDLRRDPGMRVITVAYYALVDGQRFREAAAASDDVRHGRVEVPWEGETGGPVELRDPDGRPIPLAFDHDEILGVAIKRLRGKLGYTPIGYQLLREEFALRELQEVHETILGRPLNKDSFRRRMLASGELEATGRREDDVEHRPAELYRFSRRSAV